MTSMMYIILILLILFNVNSRAYPYPYPYQGYGYGNGYGNGYGGNGWGYTRYAYVKCFSGDSNVKLSSGQQKMINYVESGDQLITIYQLKIISTDMIMMLDRQVSKEALFYTLITESGYNISLTEYHLIPIKSLNENEIYLFAKQVKMGDWLYVLKNDTIEYSKVINIITEIKMGYYAPLTMKGTLVINNILVSCFALVKDHHLAQYYMFPFRYYYKLNRLFHLHDPFDIYNSEVDKTCHTVSMMLTANLCLGELVFAYGMLVIALLALKNDLKQIQYEHLLCIVHPYLAYTGSALMHYAVVLQALHRYICLVYPNRLFWQSARFQILLILITWIISFVGSLEFLLRGEIIYNVDNQACFIPFRFSFSINYMIFSVYLIPLTIQIFIYIKLVQYVKIMSKRITPENTLFRARRDLKIVRRTVILVMILLSFGIPYVILVIISFFTNLPKYYFRIACISIDVSLVPLMIALFQFAEPVKTAVMKRLKRRSNVIVVAIIKT